MAINMLVSGKTINKMVKAQRLLLMTQNMRVSGKTINTMVMAQLLLLMAINMQVNGKMAKLFEIFCFKRLLIYENLI